MEELTDYNACDCLEDLNWNLIQRTLWLSLISFLSALCSLYTIFYEISRHVIQKQNLPWSFKLYTKEAKENGIKKVNIRSMEEFERKKILNLRYTCLTFNITITVVSSGGGTGYNFTSNISWLISVLLVLQYPLNAFFPFKLSVKSWILYIYCFQK